MPALSVARTVKVFAPTLEVSSRRHRQRPLAAGHAGAVRLVRAAVPGEHFWPSVYCAPAVGLAKAMLGAVRSATV